jgi:hypothetical protein
MTQEEFLEAALRIYPDLQPEFEELDDLFHLQMDRLRFRMERDILARDEKSVKATMELAVSCHRFGSDVMKDAIDISFAEAVFAGHAKEDIKWAWGLTPGLIKKLYVRCWGKEPI